MDNQQERLEISLEWFAGFFEAEGWISLMKTYRSYKGEKKVIYVPVCGMCNTDFEILYQVESVLKKNEIGYQLQLRKPRKETHKKSWQINMQCLKKSLLFLEWILPYLRGQKRFKAQQVIRFCKLRKEKTQGFCGVAYSQDELDLFDEIRSKILNDYTPNTAR